MKTVTVVGGGLAGCEAALQLLKRGFAVNLYEMRPERQTGAHSGGGLAELVCSNSLKSEGETASGALKAELRACGCELLDAAYSTAVPSGGALAVDRHAFSELVEKKLAAYPAFRLIRGEVTDIPDPPAIVATGPLTSESLATRLAALTGQENLHFYDATSPIVDAASVDMERAYFGGRYGKGGDDYLNLPLEKEEYAAFCEALVGAKTAMLRDFEKKELFEGCMPIEEIAKRGRDAMRFGPLRPVGLRDPRTGKGAYAVVQLRRENTAGDCFNMVGFQTNLTYAEQRRVFTMIPALREAEFLRYGVMHRNTYLNSAGTLDATFRVRGEGALYIAGQLTGVEGYMESVMSGLIAGISLARELSGKPAAVPPATTVMGALSKYVASAKAGTPPMNANFGLLPPCEDAGKKERKKRYCERSIRDIMNFVSQAETL